MSCLHRAGPLVRAPARTRFIPFRVVEWERKLMDAGRRKLALLLRLLHFRAAVKWLTWLAIDDCGLPVQGGVCPWHQQDQKLLGRLALAWLVDLAL